MIDIPSLFASMHIDFFVKIAILIIILLYDIFVFIVFNQVRSLNKILHITDGDGSSVIQAIVVRYFILATSLFFLSIVIL